MQSCKPLAIYGYLVFSSLLNATGCQQPYAILFLDEIIHLYLFRIHANSLLLHASPSTSY